LENMAMPSASSDCGRPASGHLTPGSGERSNHQKGLQRARCEKGNIHKKLTFKGTRRVSRSYEGNDACRYLRHTCYSFCLFLPQTRPAGFLLAVLWWLYSPGRLLRLQLLPILCRGGVRAPLASLFSLGRAHPVCSCHTVFFDAPVS